MTRISYSGPSPGHYTKTITAVGPSPEQLLYDQYQDICWTINRTSNGGPSPGLIVYDHHQDNYCGPSPGQILYDHHQDDYCRKPTRTSNDDHHQDNYCRPSQGHDQYQDNNYMTNTRTSVGPSPGHVMADHQQEKYCRTISRKNTVGPSAGKLL